MFQEFLSIQPYSDRMNCTWYYCVQVAQFLNCSNPQTQEKKAKKLCGCCVFSISGISSFSSAEKYCMH